MSLSAKSRFTTIMVVTASVAMLLVGALAWFEGRHSLEDAEYIHLTSVREAKTQQVEDYFDLMRKQIKLMSEDQTVVSAMVRLARGYRILGETAVTETEDAAIRDYYASNFLPKLAKNTVGGIPDIDLFLPKSQPGRHLQYEYIIKRSMGKKEPLNFNDAGDGSLYSETHAKYHKGFAEFLEAFGYYDIFLIDFDTGDIVYSVSKETDVGTNLLTGPYRTTGLAKAVRNVQNDPVRGRGQIVDFESYAPSNNTPASFLATPIFNGQHPVGILAFQVPIDKIQNIMTSHRKWREEGLGESGETYIIGSDYLMRSESRFLLEGKETYFSQIKNMGLSDDVISLIDRLNTTILLQPVKTAGAKAALLDEDSHFVSEDYRGVRVLMTSGRLNIDGLNWGIITEIDEDEAFSPIGRLLRRIIISTAIFIPIVAYLSFLLSQQFMSPVRHLSETAKDIRKRYNAPDQDSMDSPEFDAQGAAEYQELASEMNAVMTHVKEDMTTTRREKREYTDLIAAALPASVSERLKSGEANIVDTAKIATVVFAQLDNFESVPNSENLSSIMDLQSQLDDSAMQTGNALGVDVFHQIGMELIAVCGLSMPYINHAERSLKFAFKLVHLIDEFNNTVGADLRMSVGIATGPLYGKLKMGEVLDYDMIGDALSLAREAGYVGDAGAINITSDANAYFKSLDMSQNWKKTKHMIQISNKDQAIYSLKKTEVLAALRHVLPNEPR